MELVENYNSGPSFVSCSERELILMFYEINSEETQSLLYRIL